MATRRISAVTSNGETDPEGRADGLHFSEFTANDLAIRIVDATGAELAERREGRIQFRGPSATSGYFRNPEATRKLFDGDWLDSGDLAYVAEGDLYVSARVVFLFVLFGAMLERAGAGRFFTHLALSLLGGFRGGLLGLFAGLGHGGLGLTGFRRTGELDRRRPDPDLPDLLRHDHRLQVGTGGGVSGGCSDDGRIQRRRQPSAPRTVDRTRRRCRLSVKQSRTADAAPDRAQDVARPRPWCRSSWGR